MTIKIAERLRALRMQRGLRQADVAKLMRTGVGTYQCYEDGELRPDYEILIGLADFFGVSTDYLLGRTDER